MVFRFSVPAEISHGSPPVEIDSSQVLLWLDTLRHAPHHESTAALCQRLAALNQCRVDEARRLALLESYRSAVTRVARDVTQEFCGTAMPLSEHARATVSATREMLIEYACGYKILLLEKSSKRGIEARGQMPLLLHRSISALADTLSLCYMTYSPTPAGVWREMHQIYHYAAHFGLECVHVPAAAADDPPTVAIVYKQALLLALADPYRLMPGEVAKVGALVARYADRVSIVPFNPDISGAGLFLVRSDSDRPPRPLGQAENTQIAPVDKVLCSAALVEAISDGSSPEDSTVDPAGADLRRRLAKNWTSPPTRAFRRITTEAEVTLCAGLRALASQLRAAAEAAHGGAIALDHGSHMVRARQSDLSQWAILNQGAGGVALKRPAGVASPVNVGDIVGIRGYVGPSMWSIGVARWLQVDDAGAVEFGVEVLGPTADVIEVESTNAHEGTTDVLLLPEHPAANKAATVIAPPGVLVPGRSIEIRSESGTTASVSVKRLIEGSASFELFELSST